MSRTSSMNCGSGESLNASVWCGLSANARQIRLTADWLIPVAAAIERVDQCVASFGCLLERLHDHPLHLLVRDRARLARPRLVMQPVNPAPREPSPPPADRVGITAQLGRDL